MSPHARNMQGEVVGRAPPSREVPPPIDLVAFNVTDTHGDRKPRRAFKAEAAYSQWPRETKLVKDGEQSTGAQTQRTGYSEGGSSARASLEGSTICQTKENGTSY
jgi:hypothetical protein